MKKGIFVILAGLGIFFLAFSAAYAQGRHEKAGKGVMDIQRMEELKGIQARNEGRFIGIRGVLGIGIGLAEDGENPAFIVYVEKFTDSLKAKVPAHIENVPVRLIESGIFKAY